MKNDTIQTMQTENTEAQSIVIINLGGQYAHMIGRRLRDLGVNYKLINQVDKLVPNDSVVGYILSGGPQSVNNNSSPTVPDWIVTQEKPVLGICYGHQVLAKMFGLSVIETDAEFGSTKLNILSTSKLFRGIPSRIRVWMSHNDSVANLVEGFTNTASTDRCRIASFSNEKRNKYGVQFHPEVDHSEYGYIILKNFAREICGIRSKISIEDQITTQIEQIRIQAGNRRIFFFVSGGVDSMVAFTLCAQALGAENVHAVYVDTGFMRKNETDEVKSIFKKIGLGDSLTVLNKKNQFFDALGTEIDPEKKRTIIGKQFIDIQAKQLAHLDTQDWILGQGTIYPDTIESGGGSSPTAKIKTHHNRCAEVIEMIEKGKVIEPIRDFYKDEVRIIGKALELGHLITGRWPFPGPGLAIRCLCSNIKDNEAINENVVVSSIKNVVAKRFPTRSVGVQGDSRTYRDAVALLSPLSYQEIESIASEICNSNSNFNRVIYHLAGNIIVNGVYRHKAILDSDRIELLQHADLIVSEKMLSSNSYDLVWQFPVIMAPLSSKKGYGETVILRPVNSKDGMTANFAQLNKGLLEEIATEIFTLEGVDAVYLDVSDKPPATIEWE